LKRLRDEPKHKVTYDRVQYGHKEKRGRLRRRNDPSDIDIVEAESPVCVEAAFHVLDKAWDYQLDDILLIDILISAEAVPGLVIECVRLTLTKFSLPSAQVRPGLRKPPSHLSRANQIDSAARIPLTGEEEVRARFRFLVALRFWAGDERLHHRILDVHHVGRCTPALRRALVAINSQAFEVVDVVGARLNSDNYARRQGRIVESQTIAREPLDQSPLGTGCDQPFAILRQAVVRDREVDVGPVDIGCLAVWRHGHAHRVPWLVREELQRRVSDYVLEDLVRLEIEPAVEPSTATHQTTQPSPHWFTGHKFGAMKPMRPRGASNRRPFSMNGR